MGKQQLCNAISTSLLVTLQTYHIQPEKKIKQFILENFVLIKFLYQSKFTEPMVRIRV